MSKKSGEIFSSSYTYKIGLEEKIVSCLNEINKMKKGKQINHCMEAFIHTYLHHMSIRSYLVSKPNNKLISNNKQKFNSTDSSYNIFGIILTPKLQNKTLTNSQISQRNLDENQNSNK